MTRVNFDVVIVGAGAAGLTAAIGLARSGFRVAAVEAAAFPGAENWSGCVYFTENLAHPDILGPDGVEALAWERRLVERGFFATDGHGLLGMKYRDPDAFRRFLDETIWNVKDFPEYLQRCGGLPRLQELRRQEFLLHRGR